MTAEVLELDGLALRIGAGQRLIGADLGSKTIGLALSDVERRIATPLETIRRTKFAKDAARLGALMEKFDGAALVIAFAPNNGGEGRTPRAGGPRLRPQFCAAFGAPLRVLGRKAFDHGGHQFADHAGRLPRQARR